MYNFTKRVALTTTAIALFMGNITPTNNNYYEDDNDFNQVSTQLTSGWSWGVNKAGAFDCAASIDECIQIYGNYDPWDDIDPHEDDGETPPNNDAGDNDGGGGDGGEDEPEYSAYEECLRNATLLNQGCSNARIIEVTDEYSLCHGLMTLEGIPGGSNPLTQAAAYAMCEVIWDSKLDDVDAYCSAQFQDELDKCE